jgi:hypothetical protein
MASLYLEHQGAWHVHPLESIAGVHILTSSVPALLVQPSVRVRVNGERVLGGIRLLNHKDEILLDARRFVFSSESTPTVVTFTLNQERSPICATCRGPVKSGMAVVQCPGCGRWFHQLPAKPCWTYSDQCRFCQHPTALSAAAAWKPGKEELS